VSINLRPLIAIVGPTAVGKSRLALHLAQALDGEIVNADSRQVYRFMDIGPAKCTAEERALTLHHLLDVRNPDEEFSLSAFLELAHKAIEEIHRRNKLPILVGGTGQYLWALLEGWQVPKVAPNPALRADLEFQAQRRGAWALYMLLQAVAPETAKDIDSQNARRIIRALELHFARSPGGKAKAPEGRHALILGLTLERKELYRRIDARAEAMMGEGLLAEVRGLLARGYSLDLPAMSGVGYQEMGLHLSGGLTLDEALGRMKSRTHALARRQYTWFRLKDPRIRWLVADGAELEAGLAMAREHLSGCDKISSKGGV